MPLYLDEGERVTIPPTGRRLYFIDTDGVLKELKAGGVKVAVGGGNAPAFSTVLLDMTQLQTVVLVPRQVGKRWRTDTIKQYVVTNGPGLSVASVTNIGSNSANYDNVLSGLALGGAHAAQTNNNLPYEGAQNYPVVDVGSDDLKIKVTTGAAGDVQSAIFNIWGAYV